MSNIQYAFDNTNTFYPECRQDADVAILATYVIKKIVSFINHNRHLPSDKMEKFLLHQFDFECKTSTIKTKTRKSFKDFEISADTYISHDYTYSKDDIEKIHKIADSMLERRLYEYLEHFKDHWFYQNAVINRPSAIIEHVQPFRDQKPVVPQPHPR